ncbi:MAG: hypothetical protein L6R42_004681 [Xanthoria sp. 1 TBL-2021]|nr:MAG: hypothetical protein L6R42_004681 [Xanthoria sp. 1 TBL-2021]
MDIDDDSEDGVDLGPDSHTVPIGGHEFFPFENDEDSTILGTVGLISCIGVLIVGKKGAVIAHLEPISPNEGRSEDTFKQDVANKVSKHYNVNKANLADVKIGEKRILEKAADDLGIAKYTTGYDRQTSNAAVTYVHNSSGIPGAEKYRRLPLRGRRHISASQAQQLFDEDGHVEGWRRAVQAHYIFLENLELNRLEKYLLRTPSRQSSGLLAVWDLAVRDYRSLFRWRKNKDVEKRDTGILSIPTDSNAIAAKMDSTWEAEFDRTDLIERYHMYAR